MFAKNLTKIKFFIKGLNSKNRSDRNTYILVRNYRNVLCFVFLFIGPNNTNKENLFYLLPKSYWFKFSI